MAGKTDSVSIRVPYKNLRREVEVEMVGVDESHSPQHHRIELNSSPSPSSSPPSRDKQSGLMTLILSCTVAAGVQFGWALQLSLLTPYIQTLGIEHAFSSFIWLCGPITGLVVQPCVGIWSDKCTSKYGRRRPFILLGSLMISAAVILIGFSADIGYILGDTKEHCSTYKGTRTKAAIIFVIGFWMLDLANNTVQGPARALLADLSGPDQRNLANAVFCSWMAVGNILGFSSGASGNWHKWFPFLMSRACCEACANLKAAFLVAVVFLTLCTLVTLYFAKEVPLTANQSHHLSDSAPLLNNTQQNGIDPSKSKPDALLNDSMKDNSTAAVYERDISPAQVNARGEDHQNESLGDGPGAVLVNLLTSLRHLPPAMHSVLIVMALSWLSWFPFFLFDTDWMGREVYHGDPKGDLSEVRKYDHGVREGAFGLLLNSVVLGISSFLIEPMCQWMGASSTGEEMGEEEKKRRVVVESLGWLTESSIMPKKHRVIEGVGASSIMELKAHLYKSQEEAKKSKDLSAPDALSVHRAKPIKIPTGPYSAKNSGVEARAHKDKLELKAINDGTVNYAALEKKAQLYDKLVRGELSDEEDKEKYCVDFFRKNIEHDEPQPPLDQHTSVAVPPETEDGDNDASFLFNTKPLGLGRTGGTLDNDEHKRFVREVHEEANQERQKASDLKLRRQEQAAARREKLRQAYLKKRLENMKAASNAEQT